MMSRCYFINAILAALAACAPLFAQQQADSSLSVEIKETGGKPIKHVCVTVVPKEGEILFGKADSKGKIQFKHLPAGEYRVVVKADGFVAQKREVKIAAPSETAQFSLEARRER